MVEQTQPVSLHGKRVLVTGGGTRLGAAIAKFLGAHGARVIVHYSSSEAGAKQTCDAIQQSGFEAVSLQADLREPRAVRDLVDRAAGVWAGLDALVCSAASWESVRFEAIDDQAWERSMALNLRAPFILAHHASPHLKRSNGSVVFITCTSATVPYKHYLPYVVSKGALKHLMQVLALELAPEVRVNAVAPGAVLPPQGTTAEQLEKLAQGSLLNNIGRPDDICQAVHYLLTAPFVTGQELIVDGGHTLSH